jgi:hypothetical protein
MYDYILDLMIELDDGEIPCKAGVTVTSATRGSYNYNDCSDEDYYGGLDYEYVLLDKDEKPMPEWNKYLDAAFDAYVGDKLLDKLDL